MTKFKYIILGAAVALVSLSSCKDFLDKVPDTRVYLTTIDQLQDLLTTSYTTNNYALVCELSSDNMIDNNSPSSDGVRYNLSPYNRADDQIFAWEDVTLDVGGEDMPSDIWSRCYGAIAGANAVLERAEQFETEGIDGVALSNEDKTHLDAVKGEAYLIRAFHHFILANVFCMPYRGPELSQKELGIPYITEPEVTVKPHYERPTLQYTYEMIESDLQNGLKYVSDQYYEAPKYHFNEASAYAFAARFYLFKREYEKVVNYATAAFKGNDPMLMLNDIWGKSEQFYYIDEIGRYYNAVLRPCNLQVFTTYSIWLRHAYAQRYGCLRDGAGATIFGPGPSWESSPYTNHAMPAYINFLIGSTSYGLLFCGTCNELFEYTDKLAGIGYAHEVRTEFTTEECLLMRAEANLFLGNIDACVSDLAIWNHEHITPEAANYGHTELTQDQILKFYNKNPGYGIKKDIHIDEVLPCEYTLTPEMLPYMQCVQHFRRIQMVHMGMRWFDIKRLGLSITHKIGRTDSKTLEVLDPRYAIQIPSEVITAGMESNPRNPVVPFSTKRVDSESLIVPTNN